MRGFLIVPIVAVAGLINSGKSSLVAGFLSPPSRERVLRGLSSRDGTQRFTLWAPAKWKEDAAFRARLDEMFTRVFRHAPESLEESPEAAHEQQRAHNSLQVPLLAFDSALDAHGIALLDCPDVQRPQRGEAQGVNARLEALAAAGEICAGVIIVAPRTEIEVRELQAIVARLPSATRVYAINLLRREPADVILREVREHLGLREELCYGAYDFDVGANRAFAPAWAEKEAGSPENGDQRMLPCFFSSRIVPKKISPSASSRSDRSFSLGRILHRMCLDKSDSSN